MELTVLSSSGTSKPKQVALPLDEILKPSQKTIKLARQTLKQYGCNTLFSDTNPKTDKSVKFGYLTAPMHLAPAKLSGYEMCPSRSAGCTKACLHTAGNPVYQLLKNKARIARTKFFVEQPDLFKALLVRETELHIARAKKAKLKPCVRLNATSDVIWEKKFPALFSRFNDSRGLIFYDYTAISQRFSPEWKRPKNYHLTFSRKEDNEAEVDQVLSWGGSVAVVFGDVGISRWPKPMHETWKGWPVVDGDKHDLIFKHPQGSVVGLRAKGKARNDESGFVVENNLLTLRREYAKI